MPDDKTRVSKEKKVRTKEKAKRTGRKHESLKIWEYYEEEALPEMRPWIVPGGAQAKDVLRKVRIHRVREEGRPC